MPAGLVPAGLVSAGLVPAGSYGWLVAAGLSRAAGAAGLCQRLSRGACRGALVAGVLGSDFYRRVITAKSKVCGMGYLGSSDLHQGYYLAKDWVLLGQLAGQLS